MMRWLRAGSFWSHAPARRAGTIVLALLCSLAGGFSLAHPARASCICPGQITYGGVTATPSNTFGDYTLIPDAAGEPYAFLEVTASGTSGGSDIPMDTHQVGVWYDSAAGQWGVFNEDGSAMPLGVAFNVYTQQNQAPYAFFWTATSANTSSYITFINNASLNGNPSANLVVTQNWDPNNVYNPHAIGVWYDSWVGEWTIYNEDRSSIPIGASFNVYNAAGSSGARVEVASSSNISGNAFCMSDVTGSDWRIFTTHVYSGYITDVVGARYNVTTGAWCLVDASGNAMPVGATFFLY